MIQASDNIFSDFGYSAEEADNLKHRSDLMISIKKRIMEYGWSQEEAARILHVSQPRVSDLMRGKINLFTIDTLIDMLKYVGLKADMHVDPLPLDECYYRGTVSSAGNISTNLCFPIELEGRSVETLASVARRAFQHNFLIHSLIPTSKHVSTQETCAPNLLMAYKQGYMHASSANPAAAATKLGLYLINPMKTSPAKDLCI